MSLDPEQVKNIAHLARLAIDDSDVDQYAGELSQILDLVEQMSATDTSGVVPMAHPMDVSQRLRPDEVRETNQRDTLQSGAPATDSGLFLVPKVIE